MDYKKTLEYLGLKENEDFLLTEEGFEMVKLTRMVETGELDENEEPVMVEEFYQVSETPTEEQLQTAWEEVQLSEVDLALLIGKSIEGKERDFENDSLNISEGKLISFDFTHIARPTNAELLALIPSIQNDKQRQDKLDQIIALESSISPRRLREAVLSGDTSFIESIEQQILEIRNTL